MELEKELLDEFVADAREHIDTIEDDFLQLEKQKDNPDKAIVDKVFRAIHSIKGAAGFFGLDNVSKLSHVMETLLSMIRTGDIKPESRFIDALLSGVDYLSAMLDNIEYSNDMDIKDIHKRLSALLDQELSPHVKEELNTPVKLSDSEGDDIGFDISAFKMKNIAPEISLYVLKYDLTELDREEHKRPVVLIRELLSSGEILDAGIHTSSDDLHSGLPDTPLLYDVLYASILSLEQLQRTTGLPYERIVPVKKDAENMETEITPPPPETEPYKGDETECKIPEEYLASSSIIEKTVNVRIHIDILDKLMTLAGELVLVRNQKLLSINSADPLSRSIARRLDNITSELQENIMHIRMQPMGNLFAKFPRMVSRLAEQLDKKIEIKISGHDVELDKAVLEALSDPLVHIIRNCCDHGIESSEKRIRAEKSETGNITLRAWHEAGQINLEITDDGQGINIEDVRNKALENRIKTGAELSRMSDKEILALILLPGFSTTDAISDISGRGVGMDVVKTSIERLGGTLKLDSISGRGTSINIGLPLTLAIIPCLIIISGKYRYAIPQINVQELACLYDKDVFTKIECAGDQEVYRLRDTLLPMVRLSEVLARPLAFSGKVRAEIAEKYRRKTDKDQSLSLNFAVLRAGSRFFGLIIDRVSGTEEIVVKPLHSAVKSLDIYAGATVMGDGKAALILDAEGIARHAGVDRFIRIKASENEEQKDEKEFFQDVLVFKYGIEERFALPLSIIQRIQKIKMSDMERIGEKEFISINGKSTCVLRFDRFLNVSSCVEKEEMFLILPKHVNHPSGILISEIIDITQAQNEVDMKSYMEDGVTGTSVLIGHMTIFPDIYRLIEKNENEASAEEIPLTEKNIPKSQKNSLLNENTP